MAGQSGTHEPTPHPSPSAPAAMPTEPNILRRVLVLTLPLGLIAFCLLPNVGPIYRLYDVPSKSMAPNVPQGSLLIVSRASYGYARRSFDWFDLPISGRWPASLPKRGDIIVFHRSADPAVSWVKRVIGLPGDTVQMKKGRLILNGATVPRDAAGQPDPSKEEKRVDTFLERLPQGPVYLIMEEAGDQGPLDNTQAFEVPPDHLFAMGDNRDNSNDSRNMASGGVGFVPIELIIGRVVASF